LININLHILFLKLATDADFTAASERLHIQNVHNSAAKDTSEVQTPQWQLQPRI